jgi:hypothetical protein
MRRLLFGKLRNQLYSHQATVPPSRRMFRRSRKGYVLVVDVRIIDWRAPLFIASPDLQ